MFYSTFVLFIVLMIQPVFNKHYLNSVAAKGWPRDTGYTQTIKHKLIILCLSITQISSLSSSNNRIQSVPIEPGMETKNGE